MQEKYMCGEHAKIEVLIQSLAESSKKQEALLGNLLERMVKQEELLARYLAQHKISDTRFSEIEKLLASHEGTINKMAGALAFFKVAIWLLGATGFATLLKTFLK